jgi:hypothetical protein
MGCVDKSHRINLTYSEIFANCENFEFLEIFDWGDIFANFYQKNG